MGAPIRLIGCNELLAMELIESLLSHQTSGWEKDRILHLRLADLSGFEAWGGGDGGNNVLFYLNLLVSQAFGSSRVVSQYIMTLYWGPESSFKLMLDLYLCR